MRRLALLSLVLLITVALIGTQTRLWADDYCQWADATRFQNPLTAIQTIYANWAGLYSHFIPRYALWAISPSHVVIVPLLLAALAVGILYALFTTLKHPFALPYSLIVVALITIGTISQQALYWTTSSLTYTLGSLAFIGISVLLRRNTHPLLLALIAFLAAGISETPAATALVGFALWGLWHRDKRVLPILVGAGCGFLLVYIAPGNAIRTLVIQSTSDYRFSLSMLPFVMTRILGVIVQLVTTPSSLLVGVILFMMTITMPRPKVVISWKTLLIFAVMMLTSIGLSFVTRDTIPARSAFVAQLSFFALMGGIGLWLNARVSRARKVRITTNVLVGVVGGKIGLLAFALILTSSSPALLAQFGLTIGVILGALLGLGGALLITLHGNVRQRFSRLRGAWGLLTIGVLCSGIVGNLLFLPNAHTYAVSWESRHQYLLTQANTNAVVEPLHYDWQVDEISDRKNVLEGCIISNYQLLSYTVRND